MTLSTAIKTLSLALQNQIPFLSRVQEPNPSAVRANGEAADQRVRATNPHRSLFVELEGAAIYDAQRPIRRPGDRFENEIDWRGLKGGDSAHARNSKEIK